MPLFALMLAGSSASMQDEAALFGGGVTDSVALIRIVPGARAPDAVCVSCNWSVVLESDECGRGSWCFSFFGFCIVRVCVRNQCVPSVATRVVAKIYRLLLVEPLPLTYA